MRSNVGAPGTTTRRALVCAAHLILATLATRANAQGGKVSPTGQYQATLTCGSGVANVPGPNKESYTSVGLLVWDSTAKRLSNPSIVCGQSVAVGGPGAATMQWYIYVIDKAYALVKQCQSQPDTPVSGGRFACKASGTLSATLTLKPQ
jgi:hypothetical protein